MARAVSVPLGEIGRMSVYINEGWKDLKAIVAAEKPDLALTGTFYVSAKKAACHLKGDGYVWAEDPAYSAYGYAWNTGPDLAMALLPDAGAAWGNYVTCCQLIKDGKPIPKLYYNADVSGRRGRVAMGTKGGALCVWAGLDGTPDVKSPEELRDYLAAQGWDSAVMMDGGGKVNLYHGGEFTMGGAKSQNLILVWLRKDGTGDGGASGKPRPTENGGANMGQFKVCLDPGHGVESTGKCSPDGTYFEHEFALDMGRRVKALLERHGVAVVMTRTDEHCPTGKADTADLNRRVAISDQAGADLFVSLHSNAQAGSGWGTVKGYGIYTSAPPVTAARNVAARKLLARAREAGVAIWGGGLFHDIDLLVTRKTKAPAVLIEHGFHTHREETALLMSDAYREKLAEADAKGILDFLGLAWREAEKPVEPQGGAACPHCGGALRIEKGSV